jgi:signal transduction histidine kinase
VLRGLADQGRLDVLRLLAVGIGDPRQVSEKLGIPLPLAIRHLRALESLGLARSGPGDEVYQLVHHTVRLLNATLVYNLTGEGVAPGAHEQGGPVPNPPLACTLCDNRGFVSGLLDDLGSAIDESREYHGRIQEMSQQVLTAHEAERKRIARELHDDTAQALTSILIRLRLLERTAEDEQVLQNVEELRELTASALDSVRRMAMDLRPASLDDLGLVPALESYADKFSQNWPVTVAVQAEGIRRRLPRDVELVLYRIVQEALTNIGKHSSARKATVVLRRRHNQVTLVVEDDGQGFDPENVQSSGTGLGLFGMRERLALVGGQLELESTRDVGTRIRAVVPLKARAGARRVAA